MEFTKNPSLPPIIAHIKTLISMFNRGQTSTPYSSVLVYRLWRFEPVLSSSRYTIRFDDSITKAGKFNQFHLHDEHTNVSTLIDCIQLVGEQVVRTHSAEMPGVEALIVLTGLIYGMTIKRIEKVKYTNISKWYNMLCYEYILQPCPILHPKQLAPDDRVFTSWPQRGPSKSLFYLPRFLTDSNALSAVLAEQMGQLCRYYPPAFGLLIWTPNSREMIHLRFILKLAKMKALTSVIKGIRKVQKRQLRARTSSLFRYHTNKIILDKNPSNGKTQGNSSMGPLPNAITTPFSVKTAMRTARWKLISDLSFFMGNVALIAKGTKKRRVVDTTENLFNLQLIPVETRVGDSMTRLKENVSIRTLSQIGLRT